jgi:hypothetical protein
MIRLLLLSLLIQRNPCISNVFPFLWLSGFLRAPKNTMLQIIKNHRPDRPTVQLVAK